MDLKDVFEKFVDDYGDFDKVESPVSKRPDLCAFLLLDRLLPGERDLVASAEHDEIFFDVDCEALAKVASDHDILTLARCGIRYDSGVGALAMFV